MNPDGRSNSNQPKDALPEPGKQPKNLRLTHNYRSMAATYDAKRYDGPVQEFRLSYALETIERLVQPDSRMKILDVATGTGKGALCLAPSGARVVGLDFTPAMLEILRDKATTRKHLCALTPEQCDTIVGPRPPWHNVVPSNHYFITLTGFILQINGYAILC